MSKVQFKKVNIPGMTIENAKEKIPAHVTQVEKHASGVYKISFKKLEDPGYLEEKNGKYRFIHYCEANSKGSSCNHIALAAAIADMNGINVELVGFPKEPITLDLEEKDFEDVSESVGVIPPVKEEEEEEPSTLASTPKKSTPAKSTTSKPSKKRDWKKGWNEIQDYLHEQGITTRMILQIREKRQEICGSVQMTSMAVEPAQPKTPYMGETFGRAIRHILMGKDLILVGDKGSGKDTLISTIAWVLGLPLYLQTGNGDETKESIVGENTITQGAKGMEVAFKKSPFATSVEMGGLASYPELNMLSGDVTSIFHSVLDENRQLATQEGSIQRHDHNIFIGSINVGDQYSGVKKLNGAFKDRCAILKLPYVQDFRQMLIQKSGLTDSHALSFLEGVKGAIDDLIITEQQGEESKTVRGFIDAATYLHDYGVTFDTKKEVLEDFIINKTEDFEEQMAVRDMIRQKVWSDFPMSIEEEQYINGE
ncbi:MoxR-like ATPase [Evansella vedderi]|uniref:MoxR-like ATPase n=1 Tax=Evansella vedderi TaxID=38282 RepID=A0ABT9ZZJ4_9BACI|nr:AAA family ATPase [Evansella vedderi]MDQ0255520.1 MoxR-like ATPase [Evansella vedderi]